MTHPPTAPGPASRRGLAIGRTLSLERKLPLLMTALLAVILAVSLVLTYGTLAAAAESTARERLGRAVGQVAASIEHAMDDRAARLHASAASPAVRRLLAAPSPAAESAARNALASLVAPADSGLALELWDASGRTVLSAGAALDSAARARAALVSGARASRGAAPGASASDSVAFGPMYAVGGQVRFWAVAPVLDGARRLGWIAQERRVGGPRGGPASLRGLIGEDVALYMRNADAAFWASAPGLPDRPPERRDSTPEGLVADRAGVGRLLVSEMVVRGTPWLAVLEAPLDSVHGRARGTLLPLAAISLLLTLVGAALSWAISRRITRPLVSLTTAAESLARGEDARRLAVDGDDEIGRLATSFDRMAADVAAARRELERRVADAHAARRAQEAANVQLQEAIRAAEQARTDAEQANRAKGDFLAVMSHELRTPLNAIGGYAELLEMEIYGPLTEAQRDALARLSRSQAHLLGLITDVLNFAKLDAGQVRYHLTDVALDEALAALEPLVAPQVRAKSLAFAYVPAREPLVVRADRDKLQQIVLNLMGNAIKFTPAGGSVLVESQAERDVVRVHVRDTGPGIPADRLSSIFEPFVQGDRALTRPHEGVGLGLAIARELARAMGGDVAVRSVVGEGSVFTLTLPRAPVAAPPTERPPYEQQRV